MFVFMYIYIMYIMYIYTNHCISSRYILQETGELICLLFVVCRSFLLWTTQNVWSCCRKSSVHTVLRMLRICSTHLRKKHWKENYFFLSFARIIVKNSITRAEGTFQVKYRKIVIEYIEVMYSLYCFCILESIIYRF